jgi:hypothetical protein
MYNRVSKSDSYISVKEQRVDGSWYKRNTFVSKVYSNGFVLFFFLLLMVRLPPPPPVG